MRAMEAGVRKLASSMGATVENKHGELLPWGILTANIKLKVDTMTKGAEKDNMCEVHSMLHSVNRAFRTKTAHPGKMYTDEQALTAIRSVSAFMEQMSEATKADVLKFWKKRT